MKVVYHKNVAEYLNDLVDALYDKEYFGFKDAAYDYVDWIFEQIEVSINRKVSKPAPIVYILIKWTLHQICTHIRRMNGN